MTQQKPNTIRDLFLINITKELIRNHAPLNQYAQKQAKFIKKSKVKIPLKKTAVKIPMTPIKTKPLPQPMFLPKMPLNSNIKLPQISLGKITQFLFDPNVLSIESPGPGKNILVNRSGTIQTTPTTLTKHEISTIMREISEKTRIPLTSGLFKAVFGNLLITAVISEFIGTRFLIQKRTPFQKY